jgi:hypothetical protein
VAGEAHLAPAAEPRECVPFGQAELRLLRGGDQVGHRLVADVAELAGGLHEVVARVQIAGVLQGQVSRTSRSGASREIARRVRWRA